MLFLHNFLTRLQTRETATADYSNAASSNLFGRSIEFEMHEKRTISDGRRFPGFGGDAEKSAKEKKEGKSRINYVILFYDRLLVPGF